MRFISVPVLTIIWPLNSAQRFAFEGLDSESHKVGAAEFISGCGPRFFDGLESKVLFLRVRRSRLPQSRSGALVGNSK